MHPGQDPIVAFNAWLADAAVSEPTDPNAMAVATVGLDGIPSVRILLLKGADERGFVFYTNQQSRKGQELSANASAALCFHWKTLGRQVRVRGEIVIVSEAEADAYFNSRARGSQIGAHASLQSRPLESREVLEKRVLDVQAQFEGKAVPRPAHWGGYRLIPVEIEFWHDRPYRLHDRFLYKRAQNGWETSRLYP